MSCSLRLGSARVVCLCVCVGWLDQHQSVVYLSLAPRVSDVVWASYGMSQGIPWHPMGCPKGPHGMSHGITWDVPRDYIYLMGPLGSQITQWKPNINPHGHDYTRHPNRIPVESTPSWRQAVIRFVWWSHVATDSSVAVGIAGRNRRRCRTLIQKPCLNRSTTASAVYVYLISFMLVQNDACRLICRSKSEAHNLLGYCVHRRLYDEYIHNISRNR